VYFNGTQVYSVASALKISPVTTIRLGANNAAAQQLAITLNNSLGKPSVVATLRAAGIAVSDEGDIQNLTAFLDTQFEARFAFDVSLLVVASANDTLGSIRTTEISSFGDTEILGE
jgi:hypothetical protein